MKHQIPKTVLSPGMPSRSRATRRPLIFAVLVAASLALVASLVLVGCDRSKSDKPGGATTTAPQEKIDFANEKIKAVDQIASELQVIRQDAESEKAILEGRAIKGRITSIVDGDTADLLTADKTVIRIRLAWIDAPERGQPFGDNAKKMVSDLVFGREVVVIEQGKGRDKYGRMIGAIQLPGQRTVGRELVKAGMAWWYREYAPDDVELQVAESRARAAKIGLWSDPRYIAPWIWRKMSKEERDEVR